MKRRFFSAALALLTLLALCVPALAADVPEVEIEWRALPGMPAQYIPETDLFTAVNSEGKYGMIDRATGQTVTPFVYNYIQSFSEDGLAPAFQTDANGVEKYGFLDTHGQLALPVQYEMPEYFPSAFAFHEGLAAIVKTENGVAKYGFINTDGEIVLPVEYDYVDQFSEGYAAVRKGDVDSYIDHSGKSVFQRPSSFSKGSAFDSFSDGFALISNEGESHSFINTDFEILSTSTMSFWSYRPQICNGVLAAKPDNGKWGCIDVQSNWVIPEEYDDLALIDEDLIRAELGEKYGYIDYTGEIVIPIDYDSVSWYSYDNLLAVANYDADGVLRWGVLNKAGEVILPLEYDSVRLMERYVSVEKDGRYGLFESPYYVSDEPVEEAPEEEPEEALEQVSAEEIPVEQAPAEAPAAEEPAQETAPASEPAPATEAESASPLPIVLAVLAALAIGGGIILLKKKRKTA